MKAVHEDVFNAATLMKAGKLDAFFAVGGVPLDPVSDLVGHGQARLAPIDGPGRDRLLKAVPSFRRRHSRRRLWRQCRDADGLGPRLWVVRDSEPEALVYGITRALFNPGNYSALAASHPSAREIGLATAALSPPAPLHPGAARFYSESARR
jgi:TRAP-type uncharacterized transport system substrate-binding protein